MGLKNIQVIVLIGLSLLTKNLWCGKRNETVKIFCTAALIGSDYESRKREYIRGLNLLRGHGCDPYLVEAAAVGPTFLDEYCNHVCYTRSNSTGYISKGLKEAHSLLVGLKQFKFNPNDMIIKFTARYQLVSDEFIQLVEDNPDADAIVRAWHENDAYTALYAMKLEYLLDFLENYVDYNKLAHIDFCIEHLFGAYITKIKAEGAKIIYIPRVYDYLPIATPTRLRLKIDNEGLID